MTIDAAAQSCFPNLFGRNAYAILGNIKRLPAALPAIYRQVAHQWPPRRSYVEPLLAGWVYDRMAGWTKAGQIPI